MYQTVKVTRYGSISNMRDQLVFCFQCGIFGHDVKECQKPKDPDQTATPYGDWLKIGYRRKDDGKNRESNSPLERDTTSEARPKKDLRPRVLPQSIAVTPNDEFGEITELMTTMMGQFQKQC